MNSTQDSFVFFTNPPKSEEQHYLKQIKTVKINLVFADEEGIKRKIHYSPETTIKEALLEFIRIFKPNENIGNFDFRIAGGGLDINSEETVGKKFTDNALITVLETKELIGG